VAIFRQPPSGPELQDQVAQLYIETREDVYRYLLTLGVHPPKAQEAVQEVFLRLYASLKKGEKIESLRGWVFRVAHNLGLKRRRRQPRAASVEWSWLCDPAPGPEEQCLKNETDRRVQAVLRALPEQDRRCLILRAEGLRYREIAGILAMSLGAVSMSLARSLARMARAAER